MKNKKVIIILALIVLGGFFVRAYNFSDWLVFKADQSRDAFVTKMAIDNGIEYLPLLGPKIEKIHISSDEEGVAHALRLGPLYYYQQYIIAKIFHSTEPWIFAIGDLVLSALAIVLFYYFIRLYFTVNLSLLLTVFFAFSFYIIQYSRFAWNPNQLLFWELLFVLGLYKSVFNNSKKQANWWLVITLISYGIMSQLHTVALFGFLPIGIIFWLIYRPKVNWKFWLLGIGAVGLMYFPVILSDVGNKGDNVKRFVAVLTRERDKYKLTKRIKKTIGRHGEISSIMLTSFHDKEIKHIEHYGENFFLLSVLLIVLILLRDKITLFIKRIKSNALKDFIFEKWVVFSRIIPAKNPFITLLIIWIIIYFIIFIKLVNDLNRARYFLVIAPVIFIFVGLWFFLLKKLFPKKVFKTIIFIVSVILLYMNFTALAYWYHSLVDFKKYQKNGRSPKLAYHRGLITLNTMKNGLDYMVTEAKKRNKNVCYANADYQYNTGMEYLAKVYHSDYNIIKFDFSSRYNDCVFFVIARLKNGQNEIPEKILANFKVKGVSKIGAWNIWEMDYKDKVKDKIGENWMSSNMLNSDKGEDYRDVVYWKDLNKLKLKNEK